MNRKTAMRFCVVAAVAAIACSLYFAWTCSLGNGLWWIYGDKVEMDMNTLEIRSTRVILGISTFANVEVNPLNARISRGENKPGSPQWSLLFVRKHGAKYSRQTSQYRNFIRAQNEILINNLSITDQDLKLWISEGVPPALIDEQGMESVSDEVE